MQQLGISRAVPFALLAIFVAACGGAAATPTPVVTASPSPSPAATASPSPSGAASATGSPSGPPATPTTAPTPGSTPTGTPGPVVTGPASLDAPASVAADTQFDVNWTGPNALGDYVTVVAKGTAQWTNEPYFDTSLGTPGHLISPKTAGDYELWYVNGADSSIATRRPITVTPFVGTLTGPTTVAGGTPFDVAWTGPNAPGDYITILPAGAPTWTDEPWAYTSNGTPAKIVAPLEAGSNELAYVAADSTVMLRVPITVTAVVASVSGPDSASKGASISVTWTGPNAFVDYITIVPVGAAEGAYLSYAYTSAGSPATITAPDAAGNYEIRYVYGANGKTLASAAIQIK